MRSITTKLLLLASIALAIFAAWWLQQPAGQEFLAQWREPPRGAAGAPADSPAEPAEPTAASAPLIEVALATQSSVRDETQAVGTLVSRQSTALRPESSGRVTGIHFKDGQRVQKGQLLLQLDDRLERAQLQQASAELKLSRANHQRNRELVEQGFISQAALEESDANLKIAEARLALADTNVQRLRLLAPFDAIAGIASVHPGDYLREGDLIVQLQDMDVLYVDFRLPERLSQSLQVGQQARVEVEALPNESFDATVVAIDPLVDAQGRSVALRASLPNQGHRLRPGMFARVGLTMQERTEAVLVPEHVILADAQGAAVIRLTPWDGADGDPREMPADTIFRSERVPVLLGTRLPGVVEIREGLQAGDVVMTAGQHRVNRSDQRVLLSWRDDAPSDRTAATAAARTAQDSPSTPPGTALAATH